MCHTLSWGCCQVIARCTFAPAPAGQTVVKRQEVVSCTAVAAAVAAAAFAQVQHAMQCRLECWGNACCACCPNHPSLSSLALSCVLCEERGIQRCCTACSGHHATAAVPHNLPGTCAVLFDQTGTLGLMLFGLPSPSCMRMGQCDVIAVLQVQ